MREVASDLGMNHWTLRDWVSQDGMKRKKPKNAAKPQASDETLEEKAWRLERELAKPERENARLREERWVTDITYVGTHQGWAYIAVILDLFSRSVVGWALGDSLDTSLPLSALRDALKRRRPSRGLLHHSHRGCQYTSREYRDELAKRGIDASMSRKGNCWDNAVAESFFATLKAELVERHDWSSRAELRSAVFDYIEVFYNRRRLHSALDT